MYAIYYRTGGTENFEWKRAADVETRQEAIDKVSELHRAGYPAHYTLRNWLEAAGLPDTFE